MNSTNSAASTSVALSRTGLRTAVIALAWAAGLWAAMAGAAAPVAAQPTDFMAGLRGLPSKPAAMSDKDWRALRNATAKALVGTTKLLPPDAPDASLALGDMFGFSVAINGNTAVVGVPLDVVDGRTQGSAYVFVRNTSAWNLQQKLVADEGQSGDRFGASVAISGESLVVGAPDADGEAGLDQGAAFVYVRGGGTSWSLQAQLAAADAASEDRFGSALALSGDTAVVAAPFRDGAVNGQGGAYVFLRNGAVWALSQQLLDPTPTAYDWLGKSVALAGDTVVLGMPNADVSNKRDQGAALVFTRSGGAFSLQKRLIASAGAIGEEFGRAVAVSFDGSTALIGADTYIAGNENHGAAYVFRRVNGLWTQSQQVLYAFFDGPGDDFGSAVALSADGATALIGAPQDDNPAADQGAAYVFLFDGTNWNLQQKLSANAGEAGESFGSAVALDGTSALVGGIGTHLRPGSARVFTRSGNTWTQQERLVDNEDGAAGDSFGYSIAMSDDGDTVLVGVPGDDVNTRQDQGSAYVFFRSGESWQVQGHLFIPNASFLAGGGGVAGDRFGQAVALSADGNTALIGVPGDDTGIQPPLIQNRGTAYVFVRSNGQWARQANLVGAGGADNDAFGTAVALSDDGNTALIGVPMDDVDGKSDQGSAFVFVRNGTNWSSQQQLFATGVEIGLPGDFFGQTVALEGDTALISAPFDDVSGGSDQGVVHVFDRVGSTWSQGDALRAADGASEDYFGLFSIALSETTALVGAPNSDEEDRGAAYVFERANNHWVETGKLIDPDGEENDRMGTSVALEGERAIAGAPGALGKAIVFRHDGQGWSKQGEISNDGTPVSSFGFSVALSADGKDFFAGAPTEDIGNHAGQGSAYVFHLEPPVAKNDHYKALSGLPLDIAAPGVLTNDFDDEFLSAKLIGPPPSSGTFSLFEDGRLFYQSLPGFEGEVGFTYAATDGLFESTATVTIEVVPPGAPPGPVAQDDFYNAIAGVPLVVTAPGVLANDVDEDFLIAYMAGSPPAKGAFHFSSDGGFIFAPDAGAVGQVTFSYSASDGSEETQSSTATVTIDISPPGSGPAPVAVADSYWTPAGTTLNVPAPGVLSNDFDSDPMQAQVVGPYPQQGDLAFDSSGGFVYVPEDAFEGVVEFQYRVTDGTGWSVPTTVTITVGGGGAGNQAPVAASQTLSTPQGVALPVTLGAVDPDGDALTFSVQPPGQGTLSGQPPDLLYTPPAGFDGVVAFDFHANDGALDSNTATIEITIGDGGAGNQAPVAESQDLHTPRNQPLALTLIASDPEGAPLAYHLQGLQPNQGQLLGTPPDLTYVPSLDFEGVVSFGFSADDGELESNAATVTITVGNGGEGNQAPVAMSQTLYTPQATPLPIALTAIDPEGMPLVFSLGGFSGPGQLDGTPPDLSYTPPAGFNGVVVFSFRANDGEFDSNVAEVTITVGDGGPGNQPPIAHPQSLFTPHDVALSITLDATDPEGAPLTYDVIQAPQSGSISGVPPHLVYTPAQGFNGMQILVFRARDDVQDSNDATVTITVGDDGGPGNQAPIAQDQQLHTPLDVPLAIHLAAVDPEGDPLQFAVTQPPQSGALTGAAPDLLYTPEPGVAGTVSFYFRASDGASDSNLGKVTITVGDAPGNQAPIAQSQILFTPLDTPVPILLEAFDPEGDPLTFEVGSLPPDQGTLGGIAPNLLYTPAAGVGGQVSFFFHANDGEFDSNVAQVTITVGDPAGNQAPIAQSQTLFTPLDTPVPILLEAIDPEADPLTFEVGSLLPDQGTLSGVAPNLLYTPAAGVGGQVSFFFHANDGELDSNAAQVTITVGDPPGNQAPIAQSQTLFTPLDTPVPILLEAIDPEADPLTFEVGSLLPDQGTLSGVAPNLLYTPAAGVGGQVSFFFHANDGELDSNAAQVTITVGDPPGNQAPIAQSQTLFTPLDTPVSITLEAIDPEADPLTFEVGSLTPNQGTLNGVAPNLLYTPQAGIGGQVSFFFHANDGEFDSNAAQVTITVGDPPANQAPIAQSQTLFTPLDTPVPILLEAIDPEADPLTFEVGSLTPNQGTLSGVAPNLLYTPQAGIGGQVSFFFHANDGELDSNVAQVTITVGDPPGNQAPIAQSRMLTTPQGTALPIVLEAIDPEAGALTFNVGPLVGQGALSGNAPNLLYTPPAGFTGEASFSFRANDGELDSNLAEIHITVFPQASGDAIFKNGFEGAPAAPAPAADAKSILLTRRPAGLEVVELANLRELQNTETPWTAAVWKDARDAAVATLELRAAPQPQFRIALRKADGWEYGAWTRADAASSITLRWSSAEGSRITSFGARLDDGSQERTQAVPSD